jgi:uncharacterized membrane protein
MTEFLSSLVSWNHVHPVLVHFTAALLPVSIFSDGFGKLTERDSLTYAAWWMLLYGAVATPLTVFAGWMWAGDLGQLSATATDSLSVIHKWLGTSLAVAFIILTIWRSRFFAIGCKPDIAYLAFGAVVVAALMFQGYLGGKMTLG